MGTRRSWWITAALSAWAACARPVPAHHASEPASTLAPARVHSNLLRADYAGSAACADCHPALFEAWRRSPMHRMTRSASPAQIQAPFDGAVLHVGADTATMTERDGRKFVHLSSGRDGEHDYRVTKVIGGRYREDFVGVDVTGAADPTTARSAERILPVSFVLATRSWRYKGYSVMSPERPGLRVGSVWAQRCIMCHNTVPYLATQYDDLRGSGATAYQGAVSDHLLPAARSWTLQVLDAAGLRGAIADDLAHVGAARPPPTAPMTAVLDGAIAETRRRFDGGELLEVGIGCESCHSGAAEHVEDPTVRPSFELESPLLRALPPGGGPPTPAQSINRICARCHTVLFTGYPWTWEGGRRRDPVPGGSTTNSGEARDFLLGGCAKQLACTACHDPHREDARAKLDALAGPAGNALCAGCHPALATVDGLRAHSHHPPGPGSACIGCHMPKKNMGLGATLVRYHRIGSPTDPQRVLGDRPLECALCHADKTVTDLVTTMERWWGKHYDRAPLRALYGADLDVDAPTPTLVRGKPHEQAVAAELLGEHGNLDDVARLAPLLAHELPQVRTYAKRAIERLTGRPLAIDLGQPAPAIRDQVRQWLATR